MSRENTELQCSECGCSISGEPEEETMMCEDCYNREMQRIFDERRHPDDHGNRLFGGV